jgi:hypothetical protein
LNSLIEREHNRFQRFNFPNSFADTAKLQGSPDASMFTIGIVTGWSFRSTITIKAAPNLLTSGMTRSKSRKPTLTSKELVSTFLREALAAMAGVEAGVRSIRELGDLAAENRYCDNSDALCSFFDSIKPYRRFGDFQGLATLSRPRPLQLHVEPHILHGHFRAWLRKHGVDPDTIALGDDVEALPKESAHEPKREPLIREAPKWRRGTVSVDANPFVGLSKECDGHKLLVNGHPRGRRKDSLGVCIVIPAAGSPSLWTASR